MKAKTRRQVEGRRYSRRQVETATGVRAQQALLRRHAGADGRIGASFEERVAAIRRACEQILKLKGLPTRQRVFYDQKAPKAWQATRPERVRAVASLQHYVTNVLGFERDSPEDLAARILTAAHHMEIDPPRALEHAFDLGRQWSLLRVYALESTAARSAGLKGTARRSSAAKARDSKLAANVRTLLNVNPNLSNTDIARMLAERSGRGPEALRKKLPRLK